MLFFSKSTGGFYDREIHGEGVPSDAVEISEAQHAALLAGQSHGKLIVADASGAPVLQDAPPASFDQQVEVVTMAVQAELDRKAQEKGYDNIVSACSYASQPAGAPFQAEGAAFLAWRSDVWSTAYQILAEVQAGKRAMPTASEAVASMPVLMLA